MDDNQNASDDSSDSIFSSDSDQPHPKTSKLAQAAFWMGWFSLLTLGLPLTLPIFICGILAIRAIRRKPHHLTGMHLAIIGMSLNLLFSVFFIMITPGFLEAQVRMRDRNTRSEMRAYATAIEAYRINFGAYPAWSIEPGDRMLGMRLFHFEPNQPTFRMPYHGGATLTTPAAYHEWMEDPFSSPKQKVLNSYYSNANAWILWSPGPDYHYDLNLDIVRGAYDPKTNQWNTYKLAPLTYDPTNGMYSPGDIVMLNPELVPAPEIKGRFGL